MTYETFLSEAQILDYLKVLRVSSLLEREMPTLYYDGVFMANPTNEVSLLGVKFEDHETERRVNRVILCVKNRIIAVKEEAFVAMQKRYKEKQQEKEPTLFDLFG